ncbi:unnamed protein product [Cyprideis torosa]|uniref:Uncharacterized protein n=1 Tax=Cyprideis torosa TaxID=163714 RepID=A0A7R8WNZ3_9CRUS|nr:unnamed protein product [Cyprideis torosa]CAG0900181.1 unnamed protein product [Cyprideis torosa]
MEEFPFSSRRSLPKESFSRSDIIRVFKRIRSYDDNKARFVFSKALAFLKEDGSPDQGDEITGVEYAITILDVCLNEQPGLYWDMVDREGILLSFLSPTSRVASHPKLLFEHLRRSYEALQPVHSRLRGGDVEPSPLRYNINLFISSHINNFDMVVQAAKFLLERPELIPLDLAGAELCSSLTQSLGGKSRPPAEINALMREHDVLRDSIQSLLKMLWNNRDIPRGKEESLKVAYRILTEQANPSPLLCQVLDLVPAEERGPTLKHLMTCLPEGPMGENAMDRALQNMLRWISHWPRSSSLLSWVEHIIDALASAGKFQVLYKITLDNVEMLFKRLLLPLSGVRENSFAVLEKLLLGFKHSHEAFHKVAREVPVMMDRLSQDPMSNNEEIRVKLAALCHVQMVIHGGFPDIYEPVLKAIGDCPVPSQEEMEQLMSRSQWSAPSSLLMAYDASLRNSRTQQGISGRVGLYNLGNTCYLNAIIQALFAVPLFRFLVLSSPCTSSQPILAQLKRTFAFLQFSQRGAINPERFRDASIPPWFERGAQQDCEEMLRHLLVKLQEEVSVTAGPDSNITANRSDASSDSGSSGCSGRGTSMTCSASPIKRRNNSRSKLSNPREERTSLSSHCPSVAAAAAGYWLRSNRRGSGLSPSSTSRSRDEAGNSSGLAGGGPLRMKNEEEESNNNFLDGHLMETDDQHSGHDQTRSLIDLVFAGQCETLLRCLSCKGESLKQEPFTMINLAFPEDASSLDPGLRSTRNLTRRIAAMSVSLEDLVTHHFRTERLTGENRYHCEKCGTLTDAERTFRIVEGPKYLILTLMRFTFGNNRRSKIFHHVTLPETASFFTDCQQQPGRSAPEYQLISAVVHAGISAEGGHYYVYARDCEAPSAWCLLNDDTVTATSFSALSELPSKFPCDTAYVLFYQRTDVAPPMNFSRSDLSMDLRLEIDADNVRLAEDRKREMWNSSMASSSRGGSRRGGGGGGGYGGGSGGGSTGRCGDGMGSSVRLVF